VTIVAVRPATLDEIANGIPADGGEGGAWRLH
jgi:hypothetical protein